MIRPFTVAILTVSDRCSRGETTDTTGPALAQICRDKLGATVVAQYCVPDEIPNITQAISQWADAGAEVDQPVDLVLTTGGTGLAPRDVTPEATTQILERRHPGLLELARMRCFAITPRTYLSRGECGTRKRTLVINLPGSMRGGTETFEAMIDILPHALETLRGEVQDDGRQDAQSITGKVIQHNN